MDEDDFISKTQRKRQMRDLQDVGAELVKLSAEMIARLDLPEGLREAVLDCKRFTKHEAIRRQMQYIGRIMRDLDSAPIAEQLAALHAPSRRQSALFHLAERWRQDMMADPESIQRFVAEFPEADALRLRELVAAAQKEHAAERSPRHFRELFHVLNGVLQDSARRQS
jgi:ribosome-associated protein